MGGEGKIKVENIKVIIGELKRCESENKIELLRGLFCAAVADSSLAKAIVEENGVKTIAMLAAESMDNEVKRLGTGLVCLLGLTGCECPSESSMALLVESLCVIAETGPEKASKAARTQLLTLVAQNKAASEAFAGSSLFRKLGAVVEGEKCIRLAEEKVKEEEQCWAVDVVLHMLNHNFGGVAMNDVVAAARHILTQKEIEQKAGEGKISALVIARCASLVTMSDMKKKYEGGSLIGAIVDSSSSNKERKEDITKCPFCGAFCPSHLLDKHKGVCREKKKFVICDAEQGLQQSIASRENMRKDQLLKERKADRVAVMPLGVDITGQHQRTCVGESWFREILSPHEMNVVR
ncbi:uncharacterized protein MONOS_5918 [Monocercomonoides exilis]|uniref:uncharacterized protein n=1 Tax=Monocercomonoides exilis TaxID=2049356 RepID=UPI00355A2B2C|nr:hypothetical protein MONOS_5918 [Monocercomonoides exilis]|eukprot:MONOS_5918.1-p1 / transcript=MONOS_5918.1 / gene=MONOS_5918 / organism=Monocercomonoides_exilis_PA203 / gene_product=unspecified product / transcript_product=unspecified product / location=Mono_scaffold00178:82362-83742(+) / protein_length=351 / sequence_SO=supercontig / SO=protein_coding / is_pseudo=false